MENYLLDVDGQKVSYYEEGKSEKPTIVLLHGLAGSSRYSFFELSKILSAHFHIIAIDQPGHGASTSFNNEEDYLFSMLAKWYEKVFDSLLNKPFYILGHSWGADAALHYTKNFPAKVKGVILLDGGFTFPEFQEEMTFLKAYNGWDSYIDNAVYNTWEDIVSEYKTYTTRWNANIEQSLNSIFIKKEKYELLASKFTILSIIKAFFEEPFSHTYPFIKSPILLLHATEPEELLEAREKGISQLRADIKDATIISLSNTGHMVQWDKPDEVCSEIIEWVKDIEEGHYS
ncbi:alpha/beta fold hydrolase [Peribacillus deserti]|uniref:Alpha/beta hydrolase n=1 Tax=Peribacillus deserti TaxID=673318 RepID=A0A2N5M186_9BACI|nr:alpha/beta hydrolase [Peribacillus deserti]PLT28053.1 alpha/beta hydrolase [Peribacillus deserti]